MKHRKRILTAVTIGLLAPGLQAAPAQAFLGCPSMHPEGGSGSEPCMRIALRLVDEFTSLAVDAADYAVGQVEDIQAIVAELEQEIGEPLAPLTQYLDEQLAAAQAYAEGVGTDTQELAELMAQNTLDLVAAVEAEATVAARQAVADQCEPYTA